MYHAIIGFAKELQPHMMLKQASGQTDLFSTTHPA
jgi:hypothetical protein